MKKLLLSMMFSFLLTGCIDYHPRGNWRELFSNDSIKAAEDSIDDLAIQNSTHLRFKNIPIDGTLDKFVARMERNGFKEEEKMEAGKAVLRGDFAGFKDCLVYAETLSQKDLVATISVRFPDQKQWADLYKDYKHLKELLITKYGEPSASVEEFQTSPYSYPKNDSEKINHVHFDRYTFETQFITDKGEIVLWIEHESFRHTFVMLSYKDKINGTIIQNHAIDDL